MRKKKPKAPGWGGRRENQTGRPRKLARTGEARTEKVGTIVTKSVMETLKEAADAENVSVSTKIFLLIEDWAAAQTDEQEPEHDDIEQTAALSAAVNRLADVLEKITSRIRPEEE